MGWYLLGAIDLAGEWWEDGLLATFAGPAEADPDHVALRVHA